MFPSKVSLNRVLGELTVPRGDVLNVYNGSEINLGTPTAGSMFGVLAKADGVVAGENVRNGDVLVFVGNGDSWVPFRANAGLGFIAIPNAPSALVGNILEGSAVVSWGDVSNAARYEGRVNGGQISIVTSPWQVAGLASSSSHTVEVRSVGEAGASAWATVAFKTLAPKPIGLSFHNATIPGYDFPTDGSLAISTTTSADDTATASEAFNFSNYGARAKGTLAGEGFIEFTASQPATRQYRSVLVPSAGGQPVIGIFIQPSGAIYLGGGTYAGGVDSKSTLAKGNRLRLGRSADAYYIEQLQGDTWVRLGAQAVTSGELRFMASNWGGASGFKVSSIAGVGWK